MKWRHRTAKFLAGIGGGALPPLLPLLYDDFLIDRAAGTVDGTLADPGPGLRTATSLISISGGSAVFDGAVMNLWIGPVLRSAGICMLATIGCEDDYFRIGWAASNSGTAGTSFGMYYRPGGEIFALTPSSWKVDYGGWAIGSPDDMCIALRGEGAFFLRKASGADGYILIHVSDNNSLDVHQDIYTSMGTAITTSGLTLRDITVPSTIWAPTPIAADTGTVVPVIADSGTNGLDGTAVDVGLGGDGAQFFGGSSRVVLPHVDLDSSLFNAEAGTIGFRLIPPAGWWENGDNETIVRILVDGSNYIICSRIGAVDGRIDFTYKAGAITKAVSITGGTGTSPINISASWDATADEVKLYLDDSQVGSTQTGLGTWAGELSTATLGYSSLSTTAQLSDLYLADGVASEDDVETLDTEMSAGTLTTTTLDSIFDAGNYMWLPMDELYTTDGGDITEPIEQGGDGETWNGATWSNGVDGAKNTPTLGAELDSGALTVGGWYAITASQTDYFYTGSAIDDTFNAALATALDANNKVQQIPTADLFRSITTGTTPFIYIEVEGTLGDGVQAGSVLMLDDKDDPQNFVIVYHDGTSCIADKCVAGVYTNLFTIAAAEVPGVLPTASTRDNGDGTAQLWVWYDGAYIADMEVADAGIIGNTLYGEFSTSDTNRITHFLAYDTGGHTPPGA